MPVKITASHCTDQWHRGGREFDPGQRREREGAQNGLTIPIMEIDMSIGDICSRAAIAIRRTESVTEAARLMRRHHVGSLVVVEDDERGCKVPVGFLTDRDITVSVTALELDPAAITVNEIMTDSVTCVNETAGIAETVELMRDKGVRRLPVVDETGALMGIVTADDLLVLLAGELSGLAETAIRGRRHERAMRHTGD